MPTKEKTHIQKLADRYYRAQCQKLGAAWSVTKPLTLSVSAPKPQKENNANG